MHFPAGHFSLVPYCLMAKLSLWDRTLSLQHLNAQLCLPAKLLLAWRAAASPGVGQTPFSSPFSRGALGCLDTVPRTWL